MGLFFKFKSLVLLVRKAADRETAIRHVKALHAQAASTTFPAEAESARNMAAKLIVHHGIRAHELGDSTSKPTSSGYSAHDEGMNWRMNRQKEQHKDWHAKNAPWGSPNCPYCKENSRTGTYGKSLVFAKATGLGSRVLPMYMPRAVQHVPSGKVYQSSHKDDWHWDIWQKARKHQHQSEHAERSWSAGHIDPQTQVFREGPKHTYALRKYIKYHGESSKAEKSLMLVKANKLDSLTPDEEVLHSIRHNRRAMTHLEVADHLIEHIDDDPGSVVVEIAMSLAASYQENIHVLKHLDKVDQKLGDGLRKIYEVARQAEVIEQVIIKHLVTLGHAVDNGRLRDAIANGIRGAIQITHAVDKALKAWAEKNDPEQKKSLVLVKAVDQQKVEWMEHAHKALTKYGYRLQPKEPSTGPHDATTTAQHSAMHTRLYQHVTRGHQVIIDMPHEGRPDWSFVHAHSWDKGNSGHKAENLEHHLNWVSKDDDKNKSFSRGVTREVVLAKAEQLSLPLHEPHARVVHSFDDVEHEKPVKIQAYHGTHAHALEQIKEHGFSTEHPTHGLDPKASTGMGKKFKPQGGKVTHLLGQGTYFTDSKNEAGKYGSHVAKVSVHLRKPYVIHHGDIHTFRNLDHDELKRKGHDGVVVHSGKYGLHGGENYRQGVAYHPHSVKLVEEHEKMTEPGHRAAVRHKVTGESGTVRSVSGKWHEVRWNGSKKAGTKPRTEYNLEHGKHFELQKSLVLLKGYKLAYRTDFQGIPVSVENRKGSNRYWTDHNNGTKGKTKMRHPYGYVPGTEAADGDGVDVFLGPDKNATHAFVVRQMKADGKSYDEDKVMLGFNSPLEAKTAYLKHYNSPRFFGRLESYPMHQFRLMLEHNKRRPGPLRAVEVPHYEYGEVI
jgi:Inorganic Pyrophosphatase/Protein of unknown function (DUF2786)